MDHLQSLQERLRTPKLLPQLFFQAGGTAQQVVNNIDTFVAYCRKHPSFARRTVALAFNTSYAQLEDPGVKSAAHAATEVLCSEETAIAELFFEENIDGIPDESPMPDEEGCWDVEGELQRHELVAESLQILVRPESNETCLGYLQKLFGFLIRHNSEPVLGYFSAHPDKLELLLGNLRYCSVSTLVGQLLTSEDRTKCYRHETLKWRVVEFMVGELVEKAEDWEAFDGTMVLVEDILNTTKQAYYEYFQDFKRAANLLVSQGVMSRFFDLILERHEPSFRSASLFLELLFARINSESEENRYYQRGEQQVEPSMNFQIDIFLENMPALFDLVAHIESFQGLVKISYLSFLEGLFKCATARQVGFSLCQPAFIGLFDSLNRQDKAGVYRNKLYQLIMAVLASAHPQEITRFLQENHELWGKYFLSIRNANYSNTKAYNMNESSAFDVALIQQLAKKQPAVIVSASAAIGKDFKRICKKYQTKVASFQSSSNLTPEEEISFEASPLNSRIPTLSLDLINKNIVIVLPNKTTSPQTEPSGQSTLKSQLLKIDDIQEVQQIQQVIVLTDTLNTQPSSMAEALSIQQSLEDKESSKPTSIQATAKEALLKIKDKLEGQVDRVRYFAKHLSIFG